MPALDLRVWFSIGLCVWLTADGVWCVVQVYLRSIANVMKLSGCDVPSWMLEIKKVRYDIRKRQAFVACTLSRAVLSLHPPALIPVHTTGNMVLL